MDYQIICRGPKMVWVKDPSAEIIFTCVEDESSLRQEILEDHIWMGLKEDVETFHGERVNLRYLIETLPQIEKAMSKIKFIHVRADFLKNI